MLVLSPQIMMDGKGEQAKPNLKERVTRLWAKTLPISMLAIHQFSQCMGGLTGLQNMEAIANSITQATAAVRTKACFNTREYCINKYFCFCEEHPHHLLTVSPRLLNCSIKNKNLCIIDFYKPNNLFIFTSVLFSLCIQCL